MKAKTENLTERRHGVVSVLLRKQPMFRSDQHTPAAKGKTTNWLVVLMLCLNVFALQGQPGFAKAKQTIPTQTEFVYRGARTKFRVISFGRQLNPPVSRVSEKDDSWYLQAFERQCRISLMQRSLCCNSFEPPPRFPVPGTYSLWSDEDPSSCV